MSNTEEFVDLLNKEMDGLVDDYAKIKIADLEAKLAEMQNEKDELISKYRYWQTECFMTKNQTAIAELEKLKHDIWTNQHDDGWLDEQVDIYELTEMIDQQIKELKGD